MIKSIKKYNRILYALALLVVYVTMSSCLENTTCGPNQESGVNFQMIKVQFIDEYYTYETELDSVEMDTSYFEYTDYDTTYVGDTVTVITPSDSMQIDTFYYDYFNRKVDSTFVEVDTVYRYATDSFKVEVMGDTVFPRLTDTFPLLPLEISDSLTVYNFHLGDSLTETVRFHHTLPEAGFIDPHCGFTPIYQLKSFSHVSGDNFIRAYQIYNPEVSSDVTITNIYIFY